MSTARPAMTDGQLTKTTVKTKLKLSPDANAEAVKAALLKRFPSLNLKEYNLSLNADWLKLEVLLKKKALEDTATSKPQPKTAPAARTNKSGSSSGSDCDEVDPSSVLDLANKLANISIDEMSIVKLAKMPKEKLTAMLFEKTLPQLHTFCKAHRITHYSNKNKAPLVLHIVTTIHEIAAA